MNVKTKAIGGAAIIAVVALIFAYPVFAAALPLNAASPSAVSPSATAATSSNSSTATSILPSPPLLTVGQTVTFTSTSGTWRVIDPVSKPHVRSGPASGIVTLTVTGAFEKGYALSITSGTLSINGTSYSITAGSAEMGPYLAHMVGQGSLSTAGSFIMAGSAHSNFFGTQYNTLRFDVQANGVEYGVLLLVSVTHS